ncbi:MAG: type II toxin-antitoxin system RelE/ParE family toxin [Methylotenera sp.]|uniref:type II toxin-antitoxin system RelE/ParE family toxin n=1 Tax=Methylotenera sp. TaxID=2051956 RepID=UPI002488FC6B|nr:type II toxin-antitoxin system RelE/ParE family toxin [Methylotenera sp.]MDI1308403.1 type II toxin-antitoxin system RelE/ParE family toxin [Methylotenera sp.]
MKVTFHPEAAQELEEAALYYEDCQLGLGKQLTLEIETAVNLITAFPQAWTIIEPPVRRVLVRRFPFGLLYTISHHDIYILAVMHLNREPRYWKNRK